MTEPTYLLTEAQIKAAPNLSTYALTQMVQSLPMVSGEPVAYMFLTIDYAEIGGLAPLPSKRDLLEIDKQGATVIPLYTSPQALTPEDFDTWQKNPYTVVLQKSIDEDYQPKLQPITADDVTDEMVEAYLSAQRATVEESDRAWGRPNVGGLHTNTVKAACRAGLVAAISQI